MTRKTMIRQIKDFFKRIKFIHRTYSKIKIAMIKRKKFKSLHSRGYEILSEIISSLNENNICSFCAFGTLLGFVRDGGFIATDDDIDMGIIPNSDFSWAKLERALTTCGMKKQKEFRLNNIVTEQSYVKNGVQSDFFLYQTDGDRMRANVYWIDENNTYTNTNGHSVMYRYCPIINDVKSQIIHGINVSIPANYEEYLNSTYGIDWRKPDPNFKHEELVETQPNIEAVRIDFD